MTWALIHFGNISESLSNQNKASTNYFAEQSWAAAKCLKAPFHGMFLKKMSGLSLIKINYMYLIISMVLSGHFLCSSMFWWWAWQSWSPPEAPKKAQWRQVPTNSEKNVKPNWFWFGKSPARYSTRAKVPMILQPAKWWVCNFSNIHFTKLSKLSWN